MTEMTFVAGDIIKTYHKGYWRLVEIERRYVTSDLLRFECFKNSKVGDEYSSLLHYEQVMTEDFQMKDGKKKQSCDASFCTKIDVSYITEMQRKYNKGCERLLALL